MITPAFEDPTYLEAVFAALFTQIQTATFPDGIAVKSWQRIIDIPDNIPVASQPTVFLVQGPYEVEERQFNIPKWTFTAGIFVVVRAEGSAMNQNPLPSTVANYILWGLANSLKATQPYQKQTLGGLVENCWPEGAVIPEVASEQIILGLPVKMLPGTQGAVG